MWTENSKKFCSEFRCSLPIIQAPMAGGPTTPQLVSSVSNLNALGSIGAGYLSADKLRSEIVSVKELTQNTFSVNLFIPSAELKNKTLPAELKDKLALIAAELGVADYDFDANPIDNFSEQLEVVLEQKVPIFTYAFGVLDYKTQQRIIDLGVKIIGTATNTREAKILEQSGCNAVVVQGVEAGGHRGGFLDENALGTELFELLPEVIAAVKIPCIAAGGIMDSEGIARALKLGAGAVQMGTAFLTTKESGASPEWKLALLKSNTFDTVQTRVFSGKYARGLKNEFISRLQELEALVPDYPIQNELTKQIRAKAKALSNPDFQSLWAGQGSAKCMDISTSDLIAKLVAETSDLLR